MRKLLTATAVLALMGAPALAQSGGGAAAGAATGAVGGAVVGAGVGAVAGGLAEAQQPRFRQYVVTQSRPSVRVQEEVRVGAVLPASGVTYYEVPAEYGVQNYRYTVVNDQVVLVDPGSRRIVQVVR